MVLDAAHGSVDDLLREHADKVDVVLLDLTIPEASGQQVFDEAECAAGLRSF